MLALGFLIVFPQEICVSMPALLLPTKAAGHVRAQHLGRRQRSIRVIGLLRDRPA
jgi:hypothetical protein